MLASTKTITLLASDLWRPGIYRLTGGYAQAKCKERLFIIENSHSLNFVFKVLALLSQKSITFMFLTETLTFCFPHISFLTRKVFVFIHFPGDVLNFDIFWHFQKSSNTVDLIPKVSFLFVRKKFPLTFTLTFFHVPKIVTQTRIFKRGCVQGL